MHESNSRYMRSDASHSFGTHVLQCAAMLQILYHNDIWAHFGAFTDHYFHHKNVIAPLDSQFQFKKNTGGPATKVLIYTLPVVG